MEPGEPISALLVAMRQAYRDGFAPPVDASARVLRSVARSEAPQTPRLPSTRRRTPMAVVLGVPLLAAAALSWVWCAPDGAQRVVTDGRPDTAAYQGDVRSTSGAIAPASPTPRIDRAAEPSDPPARDAIVPAPSTEPPEVEATPQVDAPTPRRATGESTSRPPRRATQPTPRSSALDGAIDGAAADGPRIEALVVALQGVERNLRQDRPDLALATLDELREALEAAALREEHDALRLLALCRSRPAAATVELRARFAAGFPGSLYAERIAKTCDAEAVEPIPGARQ